MTQEETFFDIVILKPLIAKRLAMFSSKQNKLREPADERLNWSHSGTYFALSKVSHRGP